MTLPGQVRFEGSHSDAIAVRAWEAQFGTLPGETPQDVLAANFTAPESSQLAELSAGIADAKLAIASMGVVVPEYSRL